MANLEEKRKNLTRRIVDKIATDPQFREKMSDDPVGALESVGFNKEIHDLEVEANSAEVSGYAKPQWLDSWGCAH
jgi:hypothetical protein